MGEQADYFLQDVAEMEFRRSLYRTGQMDQEEAYELGIIDELGYEIDEDY